MYDYDYESEYGYESGPTKDERMWAMLCHLSAFVGLLGIPFGHILGPLIIWLLKRDESPYVDAHGRESLNFQTSMTIYLLIAGFFSVFLIGIPFLIALFIAGFVLVVIAAVKANDGQYYRYPMTIRLLRERRSYYGM